MGKRENIYLAILVLPALIAFTAFFLLPMGRLVLIAGAGEEDGMAAYFAIVTNARYFESLVATILLSVGVTLTTLVICAITGSSAPSPACSWSATASAAATCSSRP